MLNILLQAQSPGSNFGGILMIVAMIVIFYFFMIRPQSKKQKEIKKAREAIAPGDSVVTAGGIHGKVKKVNPTNMIIEVSQGVTLKVETTSIYPAAEDVPAETEQK